MEAIGQYLLSVASSAIISSIIMSLSKKGAHSKLVGILCGIFVSVTVLQPLVTLDLSRMDISLSAFPDDASDVVHDGEAAAAQAEMQVIKEQVEAYISDEAKRLGCTVQSKISLSQERPYKPISVEIYGEISPYAKRVLSYGLENDLDIPKENQHWIGAN